jgi:hypothetical protein
MKKRTKKRAKTKCVSSEAFRGMVLEEPISPSMDEGPKDLRMELENALDSARTALTRFGCHPIIVIVYAADKRMVVQPQLRDAADEFRARAMVKAWSNKHRARAAIFVGEFRTKNSGNMSGEDPSREDALIAAAKNSSEHFMAFQTFHRLGDGQVFFEMPKIIDVAKDSRPTETLPLSDFDF